MTECIYCSNTEDVNPETGLCHGCQAAQDWALGRGEAVVRGHRVCAFCGERAAALLAGGVPACIVCIQAIENATGRRIK